MRFRLRILLATLVAAIGAVVGVQAPAFAYPTTPFAVCGYTADCDVVTWGEFTWYNRTTNIDGSMVGCLPGSDPYLKHWAVFESFRGSKKIDSKNVPVNNCGQVIDFVMTIGDTNLVGGIDRIKVTVCSGFALNSWTCGSSISYFKP